ncbi:hypothetical protein, partial [Burkholderia cepacia]|uniref:hypothetical protein n=1 Tax=Burkholderia cepacia TaxID=292 RepID=UPI001C6128D3
RVSQLVNNFLTASLRLRGSSFCASRAPNLLHITDFASLSRAAFPLARKRRDSMHPAPFAQAPS